MAIRLEYRKVNRPEHPLAGPSGVIGEHRVILYDRIGPGAHACGGCGALVAWRHGTGSPDRLIADHLDRDTSNNRPDNLRPVCVTCSLLNRSVTITDDDLTIHWGNGRHVRGELRICEECGDGFVAYPKRATRFCGRACVYDSRRH